MAKLANAPTAPKNETEVKPEGNDVQKLSPQEVRARATTEAETFLEQVGSLLRQGSDLGNIALEILFQRLGESGDKRGRPQTKEYLAVLLASAYRGQSFTFQHRADLARKANAAGHAKNPLNKDVAIQKAGAKTDGGTASFRFQAPAAVEIAMGD